MSKKAILLGLDGSAQSRYAAEISWAIAKSSDRPVNAQHVVDSLAAWDFLGFDIAGFIGSGPYFAAHETMRNSLYSIGQNLVDVYKTLSESSGVPGETYLDEGTTIRELCWRAKDHELVILGHRSTGMGSPDEDKRKIPRRSVAETLTHYCPRPLLIVQDRCKLWSKMRIVLSTSQIPSTLLESCLSFASSLNITPMLRYLFTVEHGHSGENDLTAPDGLRVVTDLTRLVPSLSQAKIEVKTTNNLNNYLKADAEEDQDTLLVVPVSDVAGVRRTCFGTPPDEMVRYLNHPAILFWMEENEISQPIESKVSSSAQS